MKRRRSINANDASTVHHESLEPPPSTLTAQLLQRHAITQGQPPSSHAAVLSELLTLVREHPNDVEDDVHIVSKLISIVADAGLHPTQHSDPFKSDRTVNAHFLDCLDAIKIAFCRCPRVLFFVDAAADPLGSQLCFKILSRLCLLMRRSDFSPLQERIRDLLVTFLLVLGDSPKMWHQTPLLLRILRSTVQGKYL